MKNDKIVIINGKRYRMPSDASTPNNSQMPQRPVQKTRRMDFVRSKTIAHFAPNSGNNNIARPANKPVQSPAKPLNNDIAPTRHPLASRVDNIREQAKTLRTQMNPIKTAQTIKQEAIAEAMEKPVPVEKPAKKVFLSKKMKFVNIFVILVLFIVATGLFTYCYVPNISVQIASAQASITATFPQYVPDGYRYIGPVSYSDGEVTIKFHANTGKTKFIIKQSKSAWDSTAVKNMVLKNADEDTVMTTEERGLTIFTYDNNAAWVNGGILYTITGNAPLTSDQLRRIATSM